MFKPVTMRVLSVKSPDVSPAADTITNLVSDAVSRGHLLLGSVGGEASVLYFKMAVMLLK